MSSNPVTHFSNQITRFLFGGLKYSPREAAIVVAVVNLKGGCGKHPTWSVGGFWTSTGKGSKFDFNAETWTASAAGLISLEGVSPHEYQVQVDTCSGSKSYEIRAYPPASRALCAPALKQRQPPAVEYGSCSN